jgi:hypothetical protein
LLTKIPLCAVLFAILTFGHSFAFGQQLKTGQNANKKVKLKPLKPLSEKDIQKANKRALAASSGKSVQKANQKIFKDQAKALKKATAKAAKANRALQKAHAKALREEEKKAKAETAKRNVP